ncbi:MAG: amidohydrolase family protein, partial [Acidimicrobiia bacterium]
GEIALTDLVRLYSTAPADRYRLPKGRLAPGSDADLVLVDPEASWQVEDGDIISKAGWTPLAGRRFRGGVVSTYLRGREIARDGRCHHSLSGNFVRPR